MLKEKSTKAILATSALLLFGVVFGIRSLEDSENYYSAGAILISSILALTVAILSIKSQKKTARENNSLSFQQSLITDEKYHNNLKILFKAINNRFEIPLDDYALDEKKNDDVTHSIIYILNTWERASNAIHHGIYDGDYLYQAHKSMVIDLGIYLRKFINIKQSVKPSYYENFSRLVLRWTIKRGTFQEVHTKKALIKVFKALNEIKAGKISKHLK